MALEDLVGMFDALFPDEDEESGKGDSKINQTYLALWKRMNLAVKVLIKDKKLEDANKCIVSFFACFEDFDKLEDAIEKAERKITQSDSQDGSPEEEPFSSLVDS